MKGIQSLICTQMQIFRMSLLGILCSFTLFVYSISPVKDLCEGGFIKGTRYEAQMASSRDNYDHFHSDHIDLKRDQELESLWNSQSENTPSLLQALVPEGVFPVNHREEYSSRPYLIRLDEWGASISARAYYTHRGVPIFTNILFGVNSIRDRIKHWNRKWLVSPRAKAAVLYLHGGGMRTTGSTAFASSLTHFAKYGIEGVALDLPMHAEGPRKIFGSLQEEILSLGSFAKKYIPENVPLFVYGHSFGAVFTDELMRMTGKYNGDVDFFHPSLKGVIIGSPPVIDSSPGKSFLEKIQSFIKSQDSARELAEERYSKGSKNTWTEVVGKISPLSEFFLGFILAQMNQSVPKTEQKKLLRALMMVGKHDPLVYLGMEDLFNEYFDQLPNVSAQYFDQRPDKLTGISTEVQHILGRHQYSDNVESALDVESVVRFISKELDTTPEDLLKKMKSTFHYDVGEDSLTLLLQNYFNDLSTRYWLKHFVGSKLTKDSNYMEKLMGAQNQDRTEALKLYEQYLPENRLLSVLKRIVSAQSIKEVRLLQEEVKMLRSNSSFSLPSSLLVDLENAKEREEAESLSKKMLYEYFSEDFKYKITMDILDSIRSNKGLSQAFDVFPFDQKEFVPERSIFFLPPPVRTHILDLLNRYKNEGEPYWVNNKIVREIKGILHEYNPHVVLFRILDHFSLASKETRRQYLSILKPYKSKISQLAGYEEINKDLEVVMTERSLPKMVEQALLIIKKHSTVPVTLESYSIAKLKRRINNPEIPQQEVMDVLKSFQLSQDIQNQIVGILKDSKNSYIEVRDLVIENTPINLIYNLVQVLREMTSEYALGEFINDFPNYLLFNENLRNKYFSDLEDDQILKGVLSGDISSKEVWSQKYHLPKRLTSNKNFVYQAFKGKMDIAQALEQAFFPENIKEQITNHYNNYVRIGSFIKGRHIPSLHHFSKNLHNGEELTKEQTIEYSKRINEIKKNVSAVIQLEREEAALLKELKQLEPLMDNLNDSINHDIHLINTAFKSVLGNPPSSMTQRYHTLHRKYYTPLEKATYELMDLMYESALPLLEAQKNLTFEQIQEQFHQIFSNKDIQVLLQKREELMSAWKTKRRELTQELIDVLIQGEMGVELKQAAVNLYGHLPLFNFSTNENSHYFMLQAKSLQMAEIEAELFKIWERVAVLSVEYDRLYPNSVLSVVEPIHPMEILNVDSKNTSVPEYIKDNRKSFENLWKTFRELKAVLPPALPDLE